jgi:hypothetical protein
MKKGSNRSRTWIYLLILPIVVFDQQTNQIWMSNYRHCGDDVTEVGFQPGDVGTIQGLC